MDRSITTFTYKVSNEKLRTSISPSAVPLTRVDLVPHNVAPNETLTIRVVGRRSGTRRTRITVDASSRRFRWLKRIGDGRRGVWTGKWYSVNSQWTTGWCYAHLGFSGIDTPLRMHRPRVEGGCAFSTPPQRRSFCSLHPAGGKRGARPPLLHLSASALPLFSPFFQIFHKVPHDYHLRLLCLCFTRDLRTIERSINLRD